jgi:hypothetical protein
MTGILSRLLFFFGEWKKKKVGHEATIPPDVKCIAVPPFFLDLSRCAGMIETFCNIENLKKRHGRILAWLVFLFLKCRDLKTVTLRPDGIIVKMIMT